MHTKSNSSLQSQSSCNVALLLFSMYLVCTVDLWYSLFMNGFSLSLEWEFFVYLCYQSLMFIYEFWIILAKPCLRNICEMPHKTILVWSRPDSLSSLSYALSSVCVYVDLDCQCFVNKGRSLTKLSLSSGKRLFVQLQRAIESAWKWHPRYINMMPVA